MAYESFAVFGGLNIGTDCLLTSPLYAIINFIEKRMFNAGDSNSKTFLELLR